MTDEVTDTDIIEEMCRERRELQRKFWDMGKSDKGRVEELGEIEWCQGGLFKFRRRGRGYLVQQEPSCPGLCLISALKPPTDSFIVGCHLDCGDSRKEAGEHFGEHGASDLDALYFLKGSVEMNLRWEREEMGLKSRYSLLVLHLSEEDSIDIGMELERRGHEVRRREET